MLFAGVLVAVLLASFLNPGPAAASAVLPAGATAKPPVQVLADNGGATTAGGKATPPSSTPKPGPGAVGPEKKYPDPVLPKEATKAPQKIGNLSQAAKAGGGKTAASREILSERKNRSTVFANPDGTKTARFYSGEAYVPVNPDGTGELVAGDPNLAPAADGRLRPKAGRASFGKRTTDGTLAELRTDEHTSVGFALTGADIADVPAVVDGPDATYKAVRPGADMVLTATSSGVKETIVLASPAAPSTWTFRLTMTAGLTPSVETATGDVVFRDGAQKIRARIPHGFMADAAEKSSTDVAYAVEKRAEGWVLVMTPARAWLDDPARKYPVKIDPTLQITTPYYTSVWSSSTGYIDPAKDGYFLWAGRSNTNVSYAGYVWFDIESKLDNRYIRGSSLNLYEIANDTCPAAKPLTMYSVKENWPESIKKWPGPKYDAANPINTVNVPGKGECAAEGWVSLPIPAQRLTNIVHHLEYPWYGFTLRSEVAGSKKGFYGWNSGVFMPYLDVTYSDAGAQYELPNAYFSPPVTPVTAGSIPVRVTNWGNKDWTPTNGYRLTYAVLNTAGTVVKTGPNYPMPEKVPPAWWTDVWIDVGPLALGSYTLRLDMIDPAGKSFYTTYGSSYGTAAFTVANGAPVVNGNYPPNNGRVDSLRPTVWAGYYDPDNSPVGRQQYKYTVCGGTEAAPTGCADSGWITTPTWMPPAGTLRWGSTYLWWAQVSDSVTASAKVGPFYFTPEVTQPPVSGNFAGAANGSDAPGVNPLAGNFSTAATDVSVAVTGPPLSVQRTYNSQDNRVGGAFGAGWTTPLDQRLVVDDDGSGNAVVTLASGRQVRFGRNPDDTYISPLGDNLQLIHTAAAGTTPQSWTLRDPSGDRRKFDASGRLVSIVDASGRAQDIVYSGTSTHAGSIVDRASGRTLTLGWTGDHVTSVSTAANTSWTYTYEGNALTAVCAPLTATTCTRYRYTASSFYRSVVEDDNPLLYLPLGETSGAAAANVVARRPSDGSGLFQNVTVGSAGALGGSTDKAVTLGGASTSAVVLPDNLLINSMAMTLELWFKADPGKTGVLFEEQNKPLGQSPNNYTPALYIGQDGLLHGGFWSYTCCVAMKSAARVDTGTWHHAVVSSSVDKQTLYLDGKVADTVSGLPIGHLDNVKNYLGNGYTANWPSAPASAFPFTGSIDELAVYRHALGAADVTQHYAAGVAGQRLTQVLEPGDVPTYTIAYDTADGRVQTLTDADGGTWTLGKRALGDGTWSVALASSEHETVTHTYDADRGGRPISRADGFGTRKWKYNASGFVWEVTDENGDWFYIDTDTRGNQIAVSRWHNDKWNINRSGYYLNTADPLDPRNDQLIWSSDGRSASATDTTYRTDYTLDTAGRTTLVTYPLRAGATVRATESYVYSTGTEAADGGGTVPAGLLMSSKDRLGAENKRTYNAAGDLVRTVDPAGLVTRQKFDGLGRVIERATSGSDGTSYGTIGYTYNALSQTLTTTGPATRNAITGVVHTPVETNTYDPAGRLSQTTKSDATGADEPRTTVYGYDSVGRPASTTTPDQVTTTKTWNASGDLVSESFPGGLIRDYAYDDAHRLTQTVVRGAGVDPMDAAATSMVEETRTYSPAGRLASVTDAMGRTTTYQYTYDGLLSGETRLGVVGEDGVSNPVRFYVRQFDGAGNITRDWHPVAGLDSGLATVFTYDPAGFLTTKGESQGVYLRSWTWTRAADGQPLTLVQSSAGDSKTRKTTYGYDGAGRLTSTTLDNTGGSPASIVTKTDYDARGLAVKKTDANNAVTTLTYDEAGRQISTSAPARTVWVAGQKTDGVGPVDTIGYNTYGDATHKRDANGAVTTTGYDKMGRATRVTLASYTPPAPSPTLTSSTSTVLDARGLPITTTDPLGRVTSREYDLLGNLLSVTEPDPDGPDGSATAPRTSYAYDRTGLPLRVTNPLGAQRQATYDALARQITDTVAERGTTTAYYTTKIWYDYHGNETARISPLGERTVKEWSTFGEPWSITEPSGLVRAYTHDGLYQLVRETVGGVRATGYEYDAAGRRTVTTHRTVAADGTLSAPLTTESTAYDGVGNVVKKTSPEGRTTTYGIDAGGQTTSVTQTSSADPGTVVQVQLGYDPAGNRTRAVDGEGRATDYTYTSWGQLESTIEPETPGQTAATDRTWTTRYDKAGQAVAESSPGGVTRTLSYDGLGRLTDETGAGAEATTTGRHLEYDAGGQLTRLLSPGTDYQFTWFDRGLLKSSTGAAGTTSYEYNGNGDMTKRSGPNGTLDIGYDNSRRQKTLTDSLTGRSQTLNYNTTGELATVSYGGSVARAYTYDGLGRVATDTLGSSSISYLYDRDDLVTSKTISGYAGAGPNNYQHDALGRLTYWSDADRSVTTYGYDKASNRTSITSGGTTKTQTFDARNRLKTDAKGATYTWTARGTLASSAAGGTTTTYTSDAFDRLRTVTKPGLVSHYDYDSLDRVASYGGIALAYDGLGLEPTTLPGSTVVSRDPDGAPLAVKTGTAAGLETVADRHDDVVATVNGQTGAVAGSASYSPDGVSRAGSATLPLGFQGGWGDTDAGLVNAEARWYSPNMAGFASRDTYELGADPVTQTNRYAYGNADPITLNDPTGHCPWCLAPLAAAPELLVIAGIGIGVYAVAKTAQGEDFSMPSISMPHFSLPSWLSGSDSVPYHAPARTGTNGASHANANAEAANRKIQAELAQYKAQSAAQLAQLQQTLGQMNALYDKMWADELKLQAIKQRTAQKLALLEALKAEHARQVAAIERQNKADNAALARYYASVTASKPTSTVQRPQSTSALTPGTAAIGNTTIVTGVAVPTIVNADAYDDDIAGAAAAAGALEAEAYAATHRPDDDDDDDDSCDPVSYARSGKYRKGVRDKVFENNKDIDGLVYDPLTKRIINKDDPWQMGHMPGHEFRKLVKSAKAQKWSRKRFLDELNNFERYRPEMPKSNMCHEGEDMSDFYWGP